ncbi:CPBP family intramembrane glutamic endopeptidase [Apilactobacillus timberlakei]|uniref:CPBP family intramembrane metalloprotease n=1 Tax=Apilactobacillus timberlakei TaxID=2008380 RepID=A0ABY2YTV5_9LACO|nr:type II CAAX endopeptidase family protein [Apilactobacillus timberlakei]TPR14166.1 CPBP family intramembrane metalloprotease [Apilactobacillus timberlakei]TPR16419.1 CPBP family intramembrane metalloprotease [Apilactobacillus timberlakei]
MNESKFWSGDKLFDRIVIFILLYLMIFLGPQFIPIGILSNPNSTYIKVILSILYFLIYFLMIGIAYFSYKKHGRNDLKRPITKSNWKFIIIAYVLSHVIEGVLSSLSTLTYHETTSGNQQGLQDMLSSNKLTVVLMIFGIVIFSPILEELVFRGYLMDALFSPKFKWLPIIISGLLFGLAHNTGLNIFFFLIYAQIGFFLAYVYQKTNNLKVSIALHVLNNLISAILMIMMLF